MCKIVGWNKESHNHYLLTVSGEVISLFIGDYFHFYRTDTDILYEVGLLRGNNRIGYNRLLAVY